MDVSFTGTVEEWRSLFPTSDQSQILAAIADLKGLVQMQSAELSRLDDVTNQIGATVGNIAAVVQSVIDANTAKQQQIDTLKTALDAAVAKDQLDAAQAADFKSQLDAISAGITADADKLAAANDAGAAAAAALTSIGTSPSNPVPTPDLPPPVELPPPDQPTP